jgi:hypothetical protein
MLEKIKRFFKKNKIFILLGGVLLILLVAILVVLLSRDDSSDENYYVDRIGDEDTTPVVSYDGYQINMSDGVINEINTYPESYSTFSVKNTSHLEWAKEFVSGIKGSTLEYTEKPHPEIPGHSFHTIDQTSHYWQNDNDYITYENAADVLSFKFDVGESIQGLQIDPKSEDSIKAGLDSINTMFFSEDFIYRVDDVSIQGNYYRVEYSRLLENSPISKSPWSLYLIISPDGRLKEGIFLLAEFEKVSEVEIPIGEELREDINNLEHTKFVSFELLEIDEVEEFGRYGYTPTGQEAGSINVTDVQVEYGYGSKFDEIVSPLFLLEGEGYVEIDGQNYDAYFYVETY